VESDPQPLGPFALGVEVKWPDEERTHGYSLGEASAWHLRVVDTEREDAPNTTLAALRAHKTSAQDQRQEGETVSTQELGVTATVFMDLESHVPITIAEDGDLADAEEHFGGSIPSVAALSNIPIVSAYSLHVALYALQNPTPENIRRALYRLGTSGDCEEHIDSDTRMPLPVDEPPGWSDWIPEATS
jgi:hypothetical protein